MHGVARTARAIARKSARVNARNGAAVVQGVRAISTKGASAVLPAAQLKASAVAGACKLNPLQSSI